MYLLTAGGELVPRCPRFQKILRCDLPRLAGNSLRISWFQGETLVSSEMDRGHLKNQFRCAETFSFLHTWGDVQRKVVCEKLEFFAHWSDVPGPFGKKLKSRPEIFDSQ